ncbi:MAG: hypothetical protein ACYDEX_02480 [Mobilitalea sp.]
MLGWLPTFLFIVALIYFEVVIYVTYLIIKALRIYIRKNSEINDVADGKEVRKSTKKTVKRFVVCNIIICLLVIAISYGQRITGNYNTENVIYCSSQSDADEFKELLEENNLNYKVLNHSTRIKMQNENDFNNAISLLEENGISFSHVTNVY